MAADDLDSCSDKNARNEISDEGIAAMSSSTNNALDISFLNGYCAKHGCAIISEVDVDSDEADILLPGSGALASSFDQYLRFHIFKWRDVLGSS